MGKTLFLWPGFYLVLPCLSNMPYGNGGKTHLFPLDTVACITPGLGVSLRHLKVLSEKKGQREEAQCKSDAVMQVGAGQFYPG